MRSSIVVGLSSLLALSAVLVTAPARASFIDAGIEAGVQGRTLSDTSYKPSFAWQLHAELALLPPILMLGPYVTFNSGTPDLKTSGGDNPTSVNFRALGLRAKLKIPIPGDFKPYGVAGIGWVHGDFPDQTLKYCLDPQQPAACVSRTFPSATANFAEFVLGAGILYEIASPLAITAEFDWRPTTGYKNDLYQQQLNDTQNGAPPNGAPQPSRNGQSWTAMLGVALVF